MLRTLEPNSVGRLIDCCQRLAAFSPDFDCQELARALRTLFPDRTPALTIQDRVLLGHVAARALARAARCSPAHSETVVAAFLQWQRCDPADPSWYQELRGVAECCAAAASAAEPYPASREDSRLDRAVATIRRRFADPSFSMRAVANELGLSVWHATRLLKNRTGETFRLHLHRARVAAAARLLRDTPLSIKEIAAQVGYASSSRFGRHFKRLQGSTPREFRATAGIESGERDPARQRHVRS